jgi:hydrogenase maturation protein HypF
VNAAPAPVGHARLRIRVTGAVQGVGFRPFVHALASRYALSGFVLNDQEGVVAEVEGASVNGFVAALRREPPPMARIDAVNVTRVAPRGCEGFAIRPSLAAGRAGTRGVPDAGTCEACLDDLFDQAGRFHLYPFVTCAHCGPRYTIMRGLPYDRANTSLSGFAPCAACAADYADPLGRRFHAETIACPACGPTLSHEVADIAAALRLGQIVAVKGVGGFHLMCDALNEAAVVALRRRKARPDKPFAVMVANSASVDLIAEPTSQERALLRQPAAPIVLLRARPGLPPALAPALGRIGVMLPCAPLQHLLFHALASRRPADGDRAAPQPLVLVATSANRRGEPLVIADEAALGLTDIADLIVTHDRPILARADDSVMAVIDGAPAFIRRARGFTPEPIELGEDGPAVLAVGGHLKTTLCVTRGRQAFLSPHLGDLTSAATIRLHEEAARRLLDDLGVTPALVACDRHPDYRSTLFAQTLGLPILQVQHHAAHLAATAAEHQVTGRILGLALDGHGWGDDGAAWGGELMLRDGASWRRIGGLRALPAPGGDAAARDPWRMGVAVLTVLGRAEEAARRFPDIALAGPLAHLMAADPDGPATSSLGRLFDAAAALLGICMRQTYEGQAAMALEAVAGPPQPLLGGYRLDGGALDFRPLMEKLLEPGLTPREGGALFHGTLVQGFAALVAEAAEAWGVDQIVLGGGCLINRTLAEGLARALRLRGLGARLPCLAPANDGGLALGQAALARAHLRGAAPPRWANGS